MFVVTMIAPEEMSAWGSSFRTNAAPLTEVHRELITPPKERNEVNPKRNEYGTPPSALVVIVLPSRLNGPKKDTVETRGNETLIVRPPTLVSEHPRKVTESSKLVE